MLITRYFIHASLNRGPAANVRKWQLPGPSVHDDLHIRNPSVALSEFLPVPVPEPDSYALLPHMVYCRFQPLFGLDGVIEPHRGFNLDSLAHMKRILYRFAIVQCQRDGRYVFRNVVLFEYAYNHDFPSPSKSASIVVPRYSARRCSSGVLGYL